MLAFALMLSITLREKLQGEEDLPSNPRCETVHTVYQQKKELATIGGRLITNIPLVHNVADSAIWKTGRFVVFNVIFYISQE